MKPIFAFVSIALLALPLRADDSTPQVYDAAFNKAVSAAMIKIQAIKPGQTRKDLLKLFVPDGGITIPPRGRFDYLGCFAIKIDVDFKIVGPDKFQNPTDVILKISKPYLETPFVD